MCNAPPKRLLYLKLLPKAYTMLPIYLSRLLPLFVMRQAKELPISGCFSKESYLHKRHLHNHINELYATQVIERDSRRFYSQKKCVCEKVAQHVIQALLSSCIRINQSNNQRVFQMKSNQLEPCCYDKKIYIQAFVCRVY